MPFAGHAAALGSYHRQVTQVDGDPYFNNVILLVPMVGQDGGTFFYDVAGHALQRNGSPVLKNTVSRYGITSGYFDGNSFLQMLDSDDFYLSDLNWTLEFWMNPTSLTNTNTGNTTRVGLFQQGETSTNTNVFCLEMLNTGSLRFLYRWPDNASVDFQTPDGTIAINQWYHVALVRSGSNFVIYVNGVVKATATNSRAFDNLAYPVNIGTRYYTGITTTANAYKGYFNGFRFTKGVARYTSAFSPSTLPWPLYASDDDYYDKVVSLLHCDGANGSTALYDDVGRTWTRSGVGAISSADGVYNGSCLYFNGTTGSYYETPYSSDFFFTTTDFTIEFWMKSSKQVTSGNACSVMGSYHDTNNGNRWGIYIWNTQKIGLWYGNNGGTAVALQSATSVTDGKWHHIALARTGSTMRLFIDGVQDAITSSWPASMLDTNLAFRIGADGYTRDWYTGYLDEIRITKGANRYTTRFVPSFYAYQLPYRIDPYYSNVVSHNHFNSSPWYENKNLTITTNNGLSLPTQYADGRFGSCAYYNGSSMLAVKTSGSELTFAGDFTWEFWTRTTDANSILLTTGGGASTGQFGLCQGMPVWASGVTGVVNLWMAGGAEGSNTSSTLSAQTGVADGVWHHMAVTREGTTIRLFIDGFLHGSVTNSRIFYANQYGVVTGHHAMGIPVTGSYEDWPLIGYMDELCLTNGVCRYRANFNPPKYPFHNDRYFARVAALTHFDGAAGSTVVRDYVGRTVTLSGGAKLASEAAKAGTTGLALYNAGDFATITNNPMLEIGNNDYTIEMWYMETGSGSYPSLITGPGIILHTGADLGSGQNVLGLFPTGSSTPIVSTTRPSLNVWHHVTITRQNGTTRLFVDGALASTSTSTYTIGGSDWLMGYHTGFPTRYFRGYVDDLRVTNGVARYVTSFTPYGLSLPNS